MRQRGLDEQGDWLWGQGCQSYQFAGAALELDILTRLRSWRNDCFFDPGAGIDWYNLLGSSRVEELKKQLVQQISLVQGVIALGKFETNLDSRARRLTIKIEIETLFGRISLEETL
jgi:hypothetical protein